MPRTSYQARVQLLKAIAVKRILFVRRAYSFGGAERQLRDWLAIGRSWQYFASWLRFLLPLRPNQVLLMQGYFFSFPLACVRKEAPKVTSGRRLADSIFVQDVVEGVIAAAQAPDIERKTIEIGSGNLVSIREVVEHLIKLIDPATHPVFGALPERPMETVCAADVADSKRLTGLNPRTSLDEGLKQTALWYERLLKNGVPAFVNGGFSG
jgi:hypothetical protein